MVILIGIAVGTLDSHSGSAIPVAARDASKFYKCIAAAVGDLFDHPKSVCLIDPTVAEARAVLNRVSTQLGTGDTLLVYYSGHGYLKESRLFIPFGESDAGGRGQATIREIEEWLVSSRAERIVVLDCCRSGAALSLANRQDVFQASMTSVIASTGVFGRSVFGSTGSVFTDALCVCIERLHSERAALSLCRMAEMVQRDEALRIDCTINIREGKSDAVIPTSYATSLVPTDFTHDFLTKVVESSSMERQYLWFDLAKVPLRERLDVLRQFVLRDEFSEPSWLVRRAIGTALGSCDTAGEEWRALCLRLIDSPDWMKCCVGLIGARACLAEEAFRKCVLKLLTHSDNIDALWLAELYMADAGVEGLREVLRTPLQHTSWGLIDIVGRWCRNDEMLRFVLGAATSAEDHRAIVTHCKLAAIGASVIDGLAYDAEVVSSPLAAALYRGDRRGRNVSIELKPLLSAIYGNWRDQLSVDVREWLRNRNDSVGIDALALCARLPAVETRMLLFQELGNDPAMLEKYREGLLWGLDDSHPWVRREALRAFRQDKDTASRALIRPLNLELYPGTLDLYIEAIQHGIDVNSSIMKQKLPERSRLALMWALRVDGRAG